MVSSSKIIEANNDKEYNKHEEVKIIDFYKEYTSNKFMVPEWQRHDRWPISWRIKLIESILLNSDIPKLYITNIKNTDINYLIDGGHRLRSIHAYINNCFPIEIDDDEVYYSKHPRPETPNSRIMNNTELEIFNNYKLSITSYSNLTEKEARTKFNELQNSQPMTISDVINSHQSDLVDYLRTYSSNITHPDCYISKKMHELTSFPYKKNNYNISDVLYRMAALYTILFPLRLYYGIDEKSKYSMCSVVQGNTIDSPCLKYIKDHTDLISESDKQQFSESVLNLIELLIKWKNVNKINLSLAIVNSLYHSKHYITNFSENKFLDFIIKINEFNELKKNADKNTKLKKYEDATKLNELADSISAKYDGDIEIWEKSKRSGGSDYNAMLIRFNIIQKYCLD